MPKNKKFIDKKKAVSFQLVHRSQQDPLIVDDEAPQMVLVEKPDLNQERRTQRLEEQHKYGIYYNDDTNYLEHLKDRHDHQMEWPEHVEQELEEREKKIKFQLPSQVFASEQEESEGMLSKGAPVKGLQLDLDPDLVAAMDDDFDYTNPENLLEDNFIELADGVASEEEIDDDYMIREEDEDDVNSEDLDDVDSLQSFEQEETKTRFTNYSMSSSVIHRNDNLTLLDKRFEKDYEDFDEERIGALDGEEIEGYVDHNSQILLKMADDFDREHRKEQLNQNGDDNIKTKTIHLVDNQNDDEFVYIEVPEKEKYDCQSILSTYSNIYNHPKTITLPKTRKIKTHKTTGIPLNVLDENKLTQKNVEQINDNYGNHGSNTKSIGVRSIVSRVSELSIRPKDESNDEKRERKQKFKEFKRERRIEKKANKEAFKEEAKRQIKINLNNMYNKKVIQ